MTPALTPPPQETPGPGQSQENLRQYLQDVRNSGLVGLAPVLEAVTIILWSGQVQGERPVSALLVAPIGTGKTSVMRKVKCPVAKFLADFTSRDMPNILKRPELSHIMIGDMMAILKHKPGTVALSTRILATLSGDELLTDPWEGKEIETGGVELGVISAIPPDEIYSKKLAHILWQGGFASRYLIIRWDYTNDTKRAIHQFIESDEYTKVRPFRLHIERQKIPVHIPQPIARQITLLMAKVKPENDDLGARAHHHLRALIKACARSRGSDIVNEQDFEKIWRMSDFFTSEGRLI